jgi:SAM-dependent methyltransferase
VGSDPILNAVEQYYTEKLRRHGPTAQGVDWNSAESQAMRFAEVARLLGAEAGYSVNDYGCGYGALADYLTGHERDFRYWGYDISGEMIATARALHAGWSHCVFCSDEAALPVSDYTVASGVFNVKLAIAGSDWARHVYNVVDTLAAKSRRGCAFNMLSRFCDADRMRPDLFYADPVEMFEHCRTRFSRRVALLHDSPLYEFTILVRL